MGVQFLHTQTEQLIHFLSAKHLIVCQSHFVSAPGQTIMLKGDIKFIVEIMKQEQADTEVANSVTHL